MASEAARSLAAVISRFLNLPAIVTTAEDRLTFDARTNALLAGALHRAPDGSGHRAASMLAARRSGFTASEAHTFSRLVEECDRAVRRRAQLERGIIPGALSAREAMIVTHHMHGLR